MPVYAKPIQTTARRFGERESTIITTGEEYHMPIPDNIVLCNGCNSNIHDTKEQKGYLVYLGKRELKVDQPYDIYCLNCLTKYFPKVIMEE